MGIKHYVTRSLSEFWIIQVFYLHCDQINCHQHRGSGRVPLLAVNSFPLFYRISVVQTSVSIEAISVRISLGCKTFIVSSIYVPPSSNVRYYEQVILYMEIGSGSNTCHS